MKIFFEDGDDVISINRKIEDAVALNQKKEHNNNTDRFANFMFSLPVLPTLLVGLVKLLDCLGLLPRFVIDLSPFHTSLFITNLASINTEAIYHHCYEFGTTGVFVCMGKPVPNFLTGEYNKKIMPLGIVMDERICTGHEYALFWQTLRRYLKHPELTENGAEERAEMPEAAEATPEAEARVLRSEDLHTKVYVNQVETLWNLAEARALARLMDCPVLAGSLWRREYFPCW